MMDFRAAEPVFEVFAHCFKVTLFPVDSEGNEDVNGGVNGGANGGVNGGVMFEFIQNNPGKNTKQIQAQLNVPRRTVERRLLELKSQGKIKFCGAPKTGGYYIVK